MKKAIIGLAVGLLALATVGVVSAQGRARRHPVRWLRRGRATRGRWLRYAADRAVAARGLSGRVPGS